jgi:PKHD-type hydroxylase
MHSPYTFPDAFTPAECDRIIEIAADTELAEAGLVGAVTDHNIRRARIAWLDDCEGTGWVMDRIIAIVARANREMFDFDIREFGESPQVARYGASDGGHFDWHSDIGDGRIAARRKLTLVVQLSDPDGYQGGVLELMPDTQPRQASRGRGQATLFPSFVLHRVTPVTGGERFSLTTWAHGPAFR